MPTHVQVNTCCLDLQALLLIREEYRSCMIGCVVHVAERALVSADAGVAMQPTRAMGSGLTEQFPQAQNMSDFPAAAHDLLGLDGLLTTEERCTRDAVWQFMVRISGNRVGIHADAQSIGVRKRICCSRLFARRPGLGYAGGGGGTHNRGSLGAGIIPVRDHPQAAEVESWCESGHFAFHGRVSVELYTHGP